jgi:hypothetical protein
MNKVAHLQLLENMLFREAREETPSLSTRERTLTAVIQAASEASEREQVMSDLGVFPSRSFLGAAFRYSGAVALAVAAGAILVLGTTTRKQSAFKATPEVVTARVVNRSVTLAQSLPKELSSSVTMVEKRENSFGKD